MHGYQLERPRDLLCSIGRRAWFCDREGNTAVMGVRLMETANQPNGKQVRETCRAQPVWRTRSAATLLCGSDHL
jgi:hypothetical protein